MARYKITAPVEHVTCIVAGVMFADSVAATESEPAVAYFRRHGYGVEEIIPEPTTVLVEEPELDPVMVAAAFRAIQTAAALREPEPECEPPAPEPELVPTKKTPAKKAAKPQEAEQ